MWDDNEDHSGWSLQQMFNSIDFAKLNSISKGDTKPMPRSEEMQEMKKFVSEGGMSAINKRILEVGSTSLTEGEYTECVQEEAKRKGISFEKAMDWQAYAIVREAGYVKALDYGKIGPNLMSVEPVSVSGKDAMDVNSASKSYAQLQDKIAEQRKLAPWMSASQLYDMVFAANPELVSASVWHSAATS
jgi:hypothetical protein